MRQLADVLEVRVVRRGELRFAVDTDDVVVETVWTRCVMPNMGAQKKNQQNGSQGEDQNGDEDQDAEEENQEGVGRIQPERGSDDTQEDEEDDGEDEESEGEDEDETLDADMDERQQRPRASNNERKKAKRKGKAKAIDMDKSFTVRLSVRAFLKFLSVHVVSSTTIACVCEHHCMILYVYIGDAAEAGGVLTFYIPTRLNGSEY